MRTYTFVKDLSENYAGRASLYRVDPPVEYPVSDEASALTSFVIASATHVPLSGPQVLLYPADESGDLLDWGEVGGRKGTLDIEAIMQEWAGTGP